MHSFAKHFTTFESECFLSAYNSSATCGYRDVLVNMCFENDMTTCEFFERVCSLCLCRVATYVSWVMHVPCVWERSRVRSMYLLSIRQFVFVPCCNICVMGYACCVCLGEIESTFNVSFKHLSVCVCAVLQYMCHGLCMLRVFGRDREYVQCIF